MSGAFKYKPGDIVGGFRLVRPAGVRGGWVAICKVCGNEFIHSPAKLASGRRSCGCSPAQAYWLDLVGIDEVKRLSDDGLSSGQIAKALNEQLLYIPGWDGGKVSKNMVLGVMSRRGLTAGDPRSAPYKPKPPPKRDVSDPHDCAFPFGNPGEASFRFCHEGLARFGVPYCATHMAVAYMPMPPRPVRL